ncbi:uncharacterized protein LOC131308317 [Rhododendron vialii]|uniref:uncharacterized protein LOC131308317 n=1 Tax=Rhododendron vialii TaxID=182163 RepID=UPI00265E82CB|nr:uncharacterized protein LOC131308317 [Rhododendron vialii]
MGKEDDLWDDSALIHAFDDAISNYKTMQGRGQNDSSKAGGEVVGSMEESLSTFVDGIHEPRFPRRSAQADDNSNVASNATTEVGETSNLPEDQKNHAVDSFAQEPNVVSTSGQHVQDVHQDYSNTQGAGDYTQLVNQYYEIEEQRQKILQQLQPFGSWDYQGSSVQWEQPVSASQSSYPAVVASCCPYVGQCLVAPCSFGGTCVCRTCEASSGIGHNGNPPSFEDGDIAKTAMGAAEKALSCLKTKASEKAEESHEGQAEGKAIRETDLTDVFNAWYSAGFYTGKYLAEQSTAKKRHES